MTSPNPVRGSGFLKHMVRNIAGTLIQAGRTGGPPADLPDRSGPTVPAKGLFLVSVEYGDDQHRPTSA